MNPIRTFALLLALGAAALAADKLPIHVYPCPRAKPAPVLDGKLDDAVWQRAPLVSGFIVLDTTRLARPQTSFRVLWDDQHLYLGVRCEEPQMDKVRLVRYAHDEHSVFGHETVELFVDPNHTHDPYYQLAFSVTGSLYDGERTSTVWDSAAMVRTHHGPEFWTAEIAVPWGPLKARPAVGKVVGFNVCRDHNVGQKLYATWARLQGGFHDPDRFAHLVLSGTPEMIGGLSQEFRKGGRAGPVVVFSSEGFARQTYAKLAQAAFAHVEKLLAGLDAERRKEQDGATAAEIGRRLDTFRARLAALEKQRPGKLDAAAWTRLDIQLQALVGRLRRAVAEARLTALLDSI